MGNRKLLISGFLTFAIISGVCFLLGMSIREFPRIIAVDALPEFEGGVHTTECRKCAQWPPCYEDYEPRCPSHSGDLNCPNYWDTQHVDDGWESTWNLNTKTEKDDWGVCAIRWKCKLWPGNSCGRSTTNYDRECYLECDTLPM